VRVAAFRFVHTTNWDVAFLEPGDRPAQLLPIGTGTARYL
jgi:hypothetical protein